MKTMFRTEISVYTDSEGRSSEWTNCTEWVTKEEALNATKNVTAKFPVTGDWRIVSRTIDEATFTVTDKTVITYDWWKEVGKRKEARRCMKVWEEEIEKAKAIKARTEKGEAKKATAIARAYAMYEHYKGIAEG